MKKQKKPADQASRQEPAKKVRLEAKKYERGSGNKVKGVVDKKLRATIATQEERFEQAAASAAAAEILLPSEAGCVCCLRCACVCACLLLLGCCF